MANWELAYGPATNGESPSLAEPESVSSQTGQTKGTEREWTSASEATSARLDHTVTYFFVVTQSYAHFYIDAIVATRSAPETSFPFAIMVQPTM